MNSDPRTFGGLLVRAYTFRDDAGKHGFANGPAEMAAYFRPGGRRVFADFPATGVPAVSAVPEPDALLLCLAGVAVAAGLQRQRRAVRG